MKGKNPLLNPCWDTFLFNALEKKNPGPFCIQMHQQNCMENACVGGLHHPLLIDPLNGSTFCKDSSCLCWVSY